MQGENLAGRGFEIVLVATVSFLLVFLSSFQSAR